mgnify:FL=1
MKNDRQAFMRATRKILHERMIEGKFPRYDYDWEISYNINHMLYHFRGETKYQILHMFYNAGIGKPTLMRVHRKRFTGKHHHRTWCLEYLRSIAHRMYAQKRQQERRDEGIRPEITADVIRRQVEDAKKRVQRLEDKLQDM